MIENKALEVKLLRTAGWQVRLAFLLVKSQTNEELVRPSPPRDSAIRLLHDPLPLISGSERYQAFHGSAILMPRSWCSQKKQRLKRWTSIFPEAVGRI